MSVSSLRIAGSVVVLSSLLLLPITAWAQAEDEPFRRALLREVTRNGARWRRRCARRSPSTPLNRLERCRRARIIFGGNSTEYLPHFYLGDALKNQGDCAAAVAEGGRPRKIRR